MLFHNIAAPILKARLPYLSKTIFGNMFKLFLLERVVIIGLLKLSKQLR